MNSHIIVTILLCATQCEATNIRIWDGDTFRIGSRGGEPVRIFNIDAPEIDGKCRYETDLAQKSKKRLAALLEGGEGPDPSSGYRPIWAHAGRCSCERARRGRHAGKRRAGPNMGRATGAVVLRPVPMALVGQVH